MDGSQSKLSDWILLAGISFLRGQITGRVHSSHFNLSPLPTLLGRGLQFWGSVLRYELESVPSSLYYGSMK